MLFFSESVDILKLDFCYEAGSTYQPLPLYASSTVEMMRRGTATYSPQRLAEFLDRRGIYFSTVGGLYTATLTAYLLPRYAAEFFPVMREILTAPSFPEEDLRVFCRHKRQELTANFQRTAFVARNLFLHTLYGELRPEGRYAVPDDVDRVTVEGLRRYFDERFPLHAAKRSLAGHYDDSVLEAFRACFGSPDDEQSTRVAPGEPLLQLPSRRQVVRHSLGLSGPQASLRVGRLLPFRSTDSDAAPFEVLCCILGGYFGSRLMRNIREDKGYTYGVYCRTRIQRSGVCFEVLSDVASESVDAALTEVYREMEDLCRQPVGDDELQLVRQYMEGEFLRSIDGIFERADRWQQLAALGVDERVYTENLLHAIRHTTADQLMRLAQQYLHPDTMTEVVVMG